MLLSEAVSEFLTVRRVKLAQASQAQYARELDRFLAYCTAQNVHEVERLSASLVAGYLDMLRTTPSRRGKPRASKSLSDYFKTLHCFTSWLVQEELAHPRILHVPAPKLERKVPGTFADGQVLAMVRAAGHSRGNALQARDSAIVLLLADTGMRASECVGLTVDRVKDGYVLLKGKGAKWRECGPLSARTQRALRSYLHTWRPQHHPQGDTVFCNRTGRRMSPIDLHKLLERLAKRAGIAGPSNPHRFRHTYSRSLALAGTPTHVISALLGHSNLSTTAQYLGTFSSTEARRMVSSVVDSL